MDFPEAHTGAGRNQHVRLSMRASSLNMRMFKVANNDVVVAIQI